MTSSNNRRVHASNFPHMPSTKLEYSPSSAKYGASILCCRDLPPPRFSISILDQVRTAWNLSRTHIDIMVRRQKPCTSMRQVSLTSSGSGSTQHTRGSSLLVLAVRKPRSHLCFYLQGPGLQPRELRQRSYSFNLNHERIVVANLFYMPRLLRPSIRL